MSALWYIKSLQCDNTYLSYSDHFCNLFIPKSHNLNLLQIYNIVVINTFFKFFQYSNRVNIWIKPYISYQNIPQGARAGRGFNELNQEVRHHQGGWGYSLDHPHVQTNHGIRFFWENQFFRFGGGGRGPQTTISPPQNLIWP